jgi:hypothetical protein
MLMHEMASNLPCAADLPDFYATVRGIVRLYPCALCRENALRILSSSVFDGPRVMPEGLEEARHIARDFVGRLHAMVTASVARSGGYVSAASAEYVRVYLQA